MIVIFDWDGTLCDSVEQIVVAMQAAAQACDLPIPAPAAVRNIVGLGLPQAVAILFADETLLAQEALALAYSRCYVERDQAPARLFDGAVDTLERLRAAGFELAVATGKSRRGLDRVLSGLAMDGYFHSTRCADETRSKPDPLMLAEILAERGKTVAQAVMVGDSEYDLAMAKSLAMPSIGVSFGVHSPAQLTRHQPRAIIDQLSQLCDVLVPPAQASTG